VGDVGVATVVGDASLAFGAVVSSAASPISALPAVSCEGGRIALPSVERSTRCAMRLLFLFQSGLLSFLLSLILVTS
jgi:hypothetical protein